MSIKDLIDRVRALGARLANKARALFVRAEAAGREIAGLDAGAAAEQDAKRLLAAIEAAIAAGVNSVQHAGQTIAFGCTRELVQERDRLLRLLADQVAD